MIYPGMQYIQLPVKDLYDSQMMLASINAAKDMYEKGQQEMKDFYKEYDDFYSPFQKDMEWYSKNVTGKVRDAVDQLYAIGINPLKSPEAMQYIRRLTNSVDKGTINQMRTNAKIGEAYIDSLKKLNTVGKYDPEMEEYYLQNVLGLPSFKDFSTVGESGLNAWTSPSPVEATNLRDLTIDGFKHLTHPHDLTREEAKAMLGSNYDPRFRYRGITPQDIYDAAGDYVPGLTGDWRVNYFRNISKNRALQQNPEATEKDFEEQFRRDVAESQRQFVQEPIADYSLYDAEQRRAIEYAKMRQSQQNADRSFMLEALKAGLNFDDRGNLVAQGQEGGIIQPVDQRQIDRDNKVRNDLFTNYAQYFKQAMLVNNQVIKNYQDEKHASDIGYKEEKVKGEFVTSPSTYAPTYTSGYTKRTPYIKNKNSEDQLRKLQIAAGGAIQGNRIYQDILNGGPDKLVEYGYLDKNYNPTAKYFTFMSKLYLNPNRMKGMTNKEKLDVINDMYNKFYSAGDLAEGEYKDYITQQFGSNKTGKLPGTDDNYIISTTKKYNFNPVHRSKLFGVKLFGEDSLPDKFDKWLQNDKKCYVWGQPDDAFAGTSRGERYEQYGSILISSRDLQDFCDQQDISIDDAAKELGFQKHKMVDKKNVIYEYYEVPVTTGYTNSGGFNYSRTNQAVNKEQFGANNNHKLTPDSQRQSVMNQ